MTIINCEVCGEQFPSNSKLYKHKLKHSDKNDVKNKDVEIKDVENTDIGKNGQKEEDTILVQLSPADTFDKQIITNDLSKEVSPNKDIKSQHNEAEVNPIKLKTSKSLKRKASDEGEITHVKNIAKTEVTSNDDKKMVSITKQLFTLSSIKKVIEIQKLFKENKFDETVSKDVKMLVFVLSALSYGAIPVCQPQRDTVTDLQREIVDKLINSPVKVIKQVILDHKTEICRLFKTINSSLTFVIESFKQFG